MKPDPCERLDHSVASWRSHAGPRSHQRGGRAVGCLGFAKALPAAAGRRRFGRFQIQGIWTAATGTLLNGLAVKEQWLRHGDEIATGDSVFLFLLEDEDQALPASRVEFDDSHPTAETKVIHPKEVMYPQAGPFVAAGIAGHVTGGAGNLNALLKISRVVHAIRGLEELQAQLLDLIFEVVPAGRGAILLAEGTGQEFNRAFTRGRGRLRDSPELSLRVSRTIALQVMTENRCDSGSGRSPAEVAPARDAGEPGRV